MVKSSGLIIGGEVVPCSVPVSNWHDHGLEFKVGRGARRRVPKKEIDLFVLHWTGGEGSAKAVHRILTSRRLGVEFTIDREGKIWQHADPVTVDTFDAGRVNPRSMGVEIVNYGFRHKSKPPLKGRDRDEYRTQLNRQWRTFARFYPHQVASAIALVDACCNAVPTIPKRIPRDGDHKLIKRVMGGAELARYKGVIGHFHISRKKSDPGTEIFKAFDACGYG
jgi:N-acetylmuramoyl-L-alanine amidase